MSGLIGQANFTDQLYDVQKLWSYDLDACYRPSSEAKHTIICTMFPGRGDLQNRNAATSYYQFTAGQNYDSFSTCCPSTPSTSRTEVSHSNGTIFQMDDGCGWMGACLTSNETLAKGVEKCVIDGQRELWDELVHGEQRPTNVSFQDASVMCNYIDLERLKKGAFNKKNAGGRRQVGVRGLVVVGLMIGYALVL